MSIKDRKTILPINVISEETAKKIKDLKIDRKVRKNYRLFSKQLETVIPGIKLHESYPNNKIEQSSDSNLGVILIDLSSRQDYPFFEASETNDLILKIKAQNLGIKPPEDSLGGDHKGTIIQLNNIRLRINGEGVYPKIQENECGFTDSGGFYLLDKTNIEIGSIQNKFKQLKTNNDVVKINDCSLGFIVEQFQGTEPGERLKIPQIEIIYDLVYKVSISNTIGGKNFI